MKKKFADDTTFCARLDKQEATKISKFIHKAFIEIDDEGIDAPEAVQAPTTTPKAAKTFEALHPFLFVLRKPTEVLLLGRFEKF